jgi:hypothetical protein
MEGEWSATYPGFFTPSEMHHFTHLIRVSARPRTGLDIVDLRKCFEPTRIRTVAVAIMTELSRLPYVVVIIHYLIPIFTVDASAYVSYM